jgi:hypothetical protein
MTKTKSCVLAMVAAAIINCPGTATADPMTVSNIPSLTSPDGNNITTDPNSNGGLFLDWLDPAVTVNNSFNAVTARFATDLVGFRYATRLEVFTFFSHFPLPLPTNPGFGVAQASDGGASAGAAQLLFGTTFATTNESTTIGITADAGTGSHFLYQAIRVPPKGISATEGTVLLSDTVASSIAGSWLVRNSTAVAAVPEPATIVTLAMIVGCAGVGAYVQRRRTDRRQELKASGSDLGNVARKKWDYSRNAGC